MRRLVATMQPPPTRHYTYAGRPKGGTLGMTMPRLHMPVPVPRVRV